MYPVTFGIIGQQLIVSFYAVQTLKHVARDVYQIDGCSLEIYSYQLTAKHSHIMGRHSCISFFFFVLFR